MFDFLDSLRKKDTRTKHVIALVTSGVITLAIAGVWATTSVSPQTASRVPTKAELQQAAVSQSVSSKSPFTTIREQSARAFRDLKEQFTSVDHFVAPAPFSRGE